MLVPVRAASGNYELWRVGRRRLAFRPYVTDLLDVSDGSDLSLFIILIQVVPIALVWCVALLFTVVVWPRRALTGNWLVVAYPTRSPGQARRQYTTSTAEAKALVAVWAEAAKKGELQLKPRDAE